MEVKMHWTDADFSEMNWHDNYIHTISIPGDDCEMKFDLDYIFRWELNRETNLYRFWISPCFLAFSNVSKLRINLDFDASVGLDIDSITRFEPRLSQNGVMKVWKYAIETDKGMITFESTGYKQSVNKPPIFSEFQILPR